MKTIDDLILLTEVVEAGSLSAASRRTGIPKSTLSRRLDCLEQQLGLHLLRRDPRNFSATEIGLSVVERGRKIRDELRAIRVLAEVRTRHPAGTLRITCPALLTEVFVAAFAVRFAQENPDVRLTLDTTGGSFDPRIDHYDLAIQPAREMLADTELVRRKLVTASYCLVAAPGLLRSFRKAPTVADLHRCAGIGWSADGFAARWKLFSRNGKSTELDVDLKFNGNNLYVIKQAALGGLGLARLPIGLCESELRDGRLVVPLANWSPPAITIYALYPSRRSLTLAGKLFIAGLSRHIRGNSGDRSLRQLAG